MALEHLKSYLLTTVVNLPMKVTKKWLNSLMLKFVVQQLKVHGKKAFANEIMQLLCVEKVLEDDPTTELDAALAWANAIFSHKGFTPYQLVLGQNPNLP